MSKVC